MAIKNKDVWELLPWNIQVDILSRLSTKDLCELQSVCKDWQSIIKSPRFPMLQINANPNENAIIIHARYDKYQTQLYQIQLLSSNEIYEFDISNMAYYYRTLILATSNGLLLVIVWDGILCSKLLVFNPITKEYIELPKLPLSHYYGDIFKHHYVCDFFEHDLQSSTYKIFLAWKSSVYIYNSSSQIWQSLNSTSNLIPKYYYPFLCVTYKNDIYVAIPTPRKKLMMVVYNPIHDLWNKFDTNIESNDNNGRLIIANGRLFYAQGCDMNTTIQNYSTISIFEMNIEAKLLIPMIQIMCPKEMQCDDWYMQAKFIFGCNNKITIMACKKYVGITYDVCTHEQKEFRYNIAINCLHGEFIYPFKCTLVSPKCRQTLCRGL